VDRSKDLILDTPSGTIGGLEALDLAIPFVAGVLVFFLFAFLKLPWLGAVGFLGVTIYLFLKVKDLRAGKGWGYTKRFILSIVRKRKWRRVYVL